MQQQQEQEQQQLRVAVIGTETKHTDSKKPYTIYRTTVNFRGQCAQRLIRFRQFRWFHKNLQARDLVALRGVEFPAKKWTRSASLQQDVVEARQVLLNEYMKKVTACELTPGGFDRLLQLLKVGKYDTDAGRASSLKTQVASTSCEQSVRGELSERSHGDVSSDFARREDQRGDHAAKEVAIGPSIVFRSMTSSAETVLTEDERDERTSGMEDSSMSSTGVAHSYLQQQSQSEQAAKEEQSSEPTQQPKKVQFDVSGRETPGAAAAEDDDDDGGNDDNDDEEMADVDSPEHKYRRRIEEKMSDIQDMISGFSSLDDGPLGMQTASTGGPIRA